MDNLKQAYETMGLTEAAPKEEVEKRYMTLMRRERSRSMGGQSQNNSSPDGVEVDFAQITTAYKLILAHEDGKITQAFNEREYGKYKGMADKAQKLDHFWRYYKFHTLGAIALVALLIYGITSYVDYREEQKYLASLPPIDLSVGFMGTFMEDEDNGINALNDAMLKSFPDWKRLESSIVFVPQEQMNRYAYLQKALVTMISEKPDIYLMDRYMFEWIGNQGALTKLNEIPELASAVQGPNSLKLTVEEVGIEGSGTEAVYGFDLGKSQLFKQLPMASAGELIVGIRSDAAHPEKAIQFIETFLKTVPQ
ncbi:J domain-containing protein [Paenibacillus sp. GCM10027627]|uniref:J domain-containing protein n=1 Tax=unclassified Paenibacillus TaxID=185978 RepID=UPI003640AC23